MTRWVLLLGAVELALLGALGWIPGARSTPFPSLLIWLALFATYALATRAASRGAVPVKGIWALGAAMRLALLPLLPYYSDDVYRYMWDGWVQVNGVNPYLYPPSDPAVAGLSTPWSHLINHPDVSTIYPPGAQLVFWGLASIAPAVLTFKIAWLAADLATAWVVSRIGAARGDASFALLAYFWCPLLVLEVAWSGHLEPLGLLPMMAAVLVAGSEWRDAPAGGEPVRRGLWSGLLLAVGAAVKFAPAIALPALARRRGLWAGAAALLALALLYLVYLPAGDRLFAGLGVYAERWRFNPGPFALLERLFSDPWAVRWLAGAAVVSVAALAAWRRWALDQALLWTLGAGVALSPTVHPWYVLWLLPLAVIRRVRAWILFTGLAFLTYWGRDIYHETRAWTEPPWLGLAVWGPFLLVLLGDAVRAHRLAGRGQIADGEQPGKRQGAERAGRGQVGDGSQ